MHALTVAFAVLCLRLPLLADQPYSDEGVYAAAAYFMHLVYTGTPGVEGWLLPKDGTLGLYPLLSSWVFFLPGEPFFLLRALDALVAVAAALALYRFLAIALEDRRAALVSALLFAAGANHPAIIEAGYKNPIMAATLLTALSLVALQRGDARGCTRAGLCMSGAVLLREFFLPMGAVVALYSIARGGWSGLLRFVGAGAVLALGVVATILVLRGEGGFDGLIDAYLTYHSAAAGKSDLDPALSETAIALRVLMPLFPLAALGLAAPALGSTHRDRKTLELYLLASGLCLAPLVEICYKATFAYHVAQCVLGLAIFCALGMRVLLVALPRWRGWNRPLPVAVALVLAGTTLVLFKDHARTFYWRASSSVGFAPVMIGGDWTSPVTERSFYLRAARAIRENTDASATMIMDGSSSGLFVLAGRRPAGVAMGDLGRALSRRDSLTRKKELDRLYEAPPGIFVMILRHGVYPLDRDEFPSRLAARYPKRIVQERGVSPYGGWSAEILLR